MSEFESRDQGGDTHSGHVARDDGHPASEHPASLQLQLRARSYADGQALLQPKAAPNGLSGPSGADKSPVQRSGEQPFTTEDMEKDRAANRVVEVLGIGLDEAKTVVEWIGTIMDFTEPVQAPVEAFLRDGSRGAKLLKALKVFGHVTDVIIAINNVRHAKSVSQAAGEILKYGMGLAMSWTKFLNAMFAILDIIPGLNSFAIYQMVRTLADLQTSFGIGADTLITLAKIMVAGNAFPEFSKLVDRMRDSKFGYVVKKGELTGEMLYDYLHRGERAYKHKISGKVDHYLEAINDHRSELKVTPKELQDLMIDLNSSRGMFDFARIDLVFMKSGLDSPSSSWSG